MTLALVHRPAIPASASPYRLVDHEGHEIAWANDFLDAQRIRQLSLRSLRAYGYDLLHFARWRLEHPSRTLPEMDESTLFDYVRDQLSETPKPTPLAAEECKAPFALNIREEFEKCKPESNDRVNCGGRA